jgi:uncharacterized protein DUF6308
MTMRDFDVASGFPGGIRPIPADHAMARVVAFCCSQRTGWRSYDLAGAAARAAGQFDTVAPWSLLWADTLAGRLSVDDLDGFTLERRETLAGRLSLIPIAKDLAGFDSSERQAVSNVCTFGYPGVWAPKMTKLASLYRPQAVPILDGYLAMAFGFPRSGFSEGKESRWSRIAQVIDALAVFLAENRQQMAELREGARATVCDIDVASDLRLLDILIWCSQDDTQERAGKKRNAWLDAPRKPYEPSSMNSTPVRH